jgi:NAD(P)-dependent dehydrogenase (short-subunit alcohol dehydrogenase family)
MTERKVWLITGAGRGLGVDIAKAASSTGHAVVATGRDAAKVAAAVGDHKSVLPSHSTSPVHRTRRRR